MNNHKIQSVLYTGLLISTLTLTIGCQQPSQTQVPIGGAGYNLHLTSTPGWTIVQFPDPNDNGGDSIEIVVQDFIGLSVVEIGRIHKIEIRFQDQSLLFNIWDDQAIATNQPFEARLDLNFQQGFSFVTVEREVSYSDGIGDIYLVQGHETRPGYYLFRVEFQNTLPNINGSGNQGLLGYVELPLCEVDRTCS